MRRTFRRLVGVCLLLLLLVMVVVVVVVMVRVVVLCVLRGLRVPLLRHVVLALLRVLVVLVVRRGLRVLRRTIGRSVRDVLRLLLAGVPASLRGVRSVGRS
jgi:hypothetical protein